MRKYALFGLVVVLSLSFVGCSSTSWSKGLKDDRDATVCGKKIVQVPMSGRADTTQPEYHIQLTWHDVERGTHPALWSVVSERVYRVINLSDKIVIRSGPANFGQSKGHVTVIYYWADDRAFEINEFKYEFDLPEDPYPR